VSDGRGVQDGFVDKAHIKFGAEGGDGSDRGGPFDYLAFVVLDQGYHARACGWRGRMVKEVHCSFSAWARWGMHSRKWMWALASK
jgi:hypothetical protein